MVTGSAAELDEGDPPGDDNGEGERVRAAQRKRTRLRGRVKARNEVRRFDFPLTLLSSPSTPPSPPPYDSATMMRSECLTRKNGACEVARSRGTPVHSRTVSSFRRGNVRVKGTWASTVNHRLGCMPSAHLRA
jgi:hypothetical protein